MIPTQAVVDVINNFVITSEDIWGATGFPAAVAQPIIVPFVPSAELTSGELTYATFEGSEAIVLNAQPQLGIIDSQTGRVGVLIKEPVGGLKWIATDVTDLPQTIYGWAIRDNDDGSLLFSELLPEPVVISAVGNFVEVTAVLGYAKINPYDSDLEA